MIGRRKGEEGKKGNCSLKREGEGRLKARREEEGKKPLLRVEEEG